MTKRPDAAGQSSRPSARPSVKEQRRERARAKQERLDRHQQTEAADGARIAGIRFRIPDRAGSPRVVAHIGPTNSGKTHAALDALVANGRGAYASPLRMLAQEVHGRLAARLGDHAVGLVTGEERINERAPIVACTVELAPPDAEVLVVDEVHWASDAERGQAWTRLFLEASGREMHLVGSPDAMPLLAAAFPDLEVRAYQRFGPLDFVGTVHIDDVREGTVVVAFSRKAVLALARDLSERRPGRVGALYGAMPLAERRVQIARFLAGETAVLVATDVLGHGVNLPCHTVLFAETDKFDGAVRRPLEPWEVAQIAGRAGRFGHHDAGEVGVLAGPAWVATDPLVVRAGLTGGMMPVPGGPPLPSFRRIEWAMLGPQLRELDGISPAGWPRALLAWRLAMKAGEDRRSWVRVADVQPHVARLLSIEPEVLAGLPRETAWAFALAPVDAEEQGGLIRAFAQAVAGRRTLRPLVDVGRLDGATLEATEGIAGQASVLRWFARRFPGAGGITAAAADRLEEAAAAHARSLMDGQVAGNEYGLCARCGRACKPWFDRCDDCFSGRPLRGAAGTPPARARPRDHRSPRGPRIVRGRHR